MLENQLKFVFTKKYGIIKKDLQKKGEYYGEGEG